MTQVLEPTAYTPPILEPLGTLRSLTRGAGPGGEPMFMLSPPFADGYQPPSLTVLGTLRNLTSGAGPAGEPIVVQSIGATPGNREPEPATSR